MLKINNYEFCLKSAEINFRQRTYMEKSYITVNIETEFFPIIYNESILYGNVSIKVDLANISSINDLIDKEFSKDIGTIQICVNNDGIWENNIIENFKVKFKKRDKKLLHFEIEAKDFIYKDCATMVSLYTTSTSEENLKKVFDLTDFYDKTFKKQIGSSLITKYFIK